MSVYLKSRQEKYMVIDSIYTHFSENAELSYDVGAITYLEMLNAKSKHDQVRIMQSQLKHDVDIAMAKLATAMHYDTLFSLPAQAPVELTIDGAGVDSDPGLLYMQHAILLQEASMKVEKNRLLPDVTLGYFNGTNAYAGARNYQGFEVGLGIPIFFSEQRAKIKAGRYAGEAALNLKANYIRVYNNNISEIISEMEKFREYVTYYEQTGKQLAAELYRSAQKSFAAGEIDFFRFVQSMDSAIEIELTYLENLFKYNEMVLEINYMTL